MSTALAFSGGKDSMACLHLMRDQLDFAIHVDTGFAYPETQALVDYARTILPVHVVHADRAGQNAREGLPADVVPIEWTRQGQELTHAKPVMVQSYLGCCYENLVVPLFRAAFQRGVTRMVYGQRNQEPRKSPARDGDVVYGITRVHPIEDWTTEEVFAYLATKMDVPEHYRLKHSSLDCFDCTAYAADSADRVEWMRERHPEFHVAYMKRADALKGALAAALGRSV